MAVKRYNLTFNRQQAGTPIIYNLGAKFRVTPIIEKAMMSEEGGFMRVAFNGDPDEIGRAMADLQLTGVAVTDEDLATMF